MNGSLEPLISVITPAHQHERFIEATIQSVLGQTWPNIQYILIDDGSTDKTSQVIQKLKSECETHFSSFTFVKQKNQGTVSSLNEALTYAQGEYVFFLASDDVIHPEALVRLYEALISDPHCGLVVPDNWIMDEKGTRCFWNKERQNVYTIEEANFKTFGEYLQYIRTDVLFLSDSFGRYDTLVRGNYFPNGPFMRLATLNQVGRFSALAPLEDLYLLFQISKISKIKFLNEPLLGYRWHSANTILNSARVNIMTLETNDFEYAYCKNKGLSYLWYLTQFKLIIRILWARPSHLKKLTWKHWRVLFGGIGPFVRDAYKRFAK
jgi:alpha-1,3-rhamnosyltransferase